MIEVKFRGETAGEVFSSILDFVTSSKKESNIAPVQVYREEQAVAAAAPAVNQTHNAATAPAPLEEKKKRGRPPSKKDEPQAQPQLPPQPEVIETKAPQALATATETPVIQYPTHEEALAAIKAITEKHGMEKGIPIGRDCLSRFGYQRVSEVKEGDRHEFIELCKAANALGSVPTTR